MNFIIYAMTDVGIKKHTNQDSYNVRTLNTNLGKMVFAVLCDGMGGLEKGEVASSSLVNAFVRWVDEKLPEICERGITDNEIRSDWTEIAITYNEKIKQYSNKLGLTTGIGTTVTALLLTEKRYYIINVGDTRVYEIQNGLRVLTKDQTLVAQEVEKGLITQAQADSDPRRSILLQCIGASKEVYPDMFFGDTKLNAVYMLCTDGFRHEISEDEIYNYFNPDVMSDVNNMHRSSENLIELDKQRQENDNISVITIRTF